MDADEVCAAVVMCLTGRPFLRSRHFIFVEDVAAAFITVLHKGIEGETYNIGCEEECTNLEIAEKLVSAVKPGSNPKDHIMFVADRPFNDVRYYISSKKLMSLGWKPEVDLEEGLKKTVDWYTKVSPPQLPAQTRQPYRESPRLCLRRLPAVSTRTFRAGAY